MIDCDLLLSCDRICCLELIEKIKKKIDESRSKIIIVDDWNWKSLLFDFSFLQHASGLLSCEIASLN